MPSHIDVRIGDYQRVIEANTKAIEADEAFEARAGAANFYSYYRMHNYHFLVYGAMFDGQSELALQTARLIPDQVPEAMLREQTDFLDAFMPMPLHVMIRFGQWEELLKEPKPADFLPMSIATWHYARGIAYAATNRVAEAKGEQQQFEEAKNRIPDTSVLFNNTSKDILAVAEAMLAGEILYREQEYILAFEQLRMAVDRDDALNYDEPWGWMQPARHALGALLLEQGELEEAEKVFRQDLARHPNNLWSLRGLTEVLERRGASPEAKTVEEQLSVAVSRADVSVDRSCYCRTLVFEQAKADAECCLESGENPGQDCCVESKSASSPK